MFISPQSSIVLKVVCLLAILFGACTQARNGLCVKGVSVTEVTHIGNGSVPIVTRISFGEGRLYLEEDGGVSRCKTNPIAVGRLESAYYKQDVQALLAEVRRNPEKYHFMADVRSVVFEVSGGDVQVDYRNLPPALQELLREIDREFRDNFGSAYKISMRF